MDEALILDVSRDAVLTMITLAGPILMAGMAIGLTIALFQTLTQIQEMTLVFVPKILVVFVAVLLLLPWMVREITEFMERLMDIVISLE